MGDLPMQTKGTCFLCLNKITVSQVLLEEEEKSVDHFPSSSLQSLQYLTRYLQINFDTLLDQAEADPNHALSHLAQPQSGKVKLNSAELCAECAALNDLFSKLFRQLEKIEMEVASCFDHILVKLLHTSVVNTSEVTQGGGNMGMLEALRRDMTEKCFQKLSTVVPRVKLQNMTTLLGNTSHNDKTSSPDTENDVETMGFINPSFDNQSSSPDIKIEIADIKVERPAENSIPYDDNSDNDNNGSSYQDNLDMKVGDSISSDDDDNNMKKCRINNASIKGPRMSTVGRKYPEPKLIYESKLGIPSKPKSSRNRKTGRHSCSLCFQEFCDRSSFLVHYKREHLKFKLQCPLCPKISTQRSDYSLHFRTVHVGATFTCQHCNRIFNRQSNVTRHQRMGHCQNMKKKGP